MEVHIGHLGDPEPFQARVQTRDSEVVPGHVDPASLDPEDVRSPSATGRDGSPGQQELAA
jgi:hypothetical protein